MHPLDALVVVLYILLIFWLSWKAGRRARAQSPTPEGQYLADRSLSFLESICSIIATEVSALTFLGIPAFAFNKNFSFAQIYLGAMLGRIVVALVFLPRVYGKGLTLYEVMARGSQDTGRRATAALYALSKIFSVGVRLFSGSILVTQFLQVDVYVSLIAIACLTFLYTLMGGLKAVVRVDMLQLALFVGAGVLAHFLIPSVAQAPWGELMALAQVSGKTTLFPLDQPWSIVAGIMGGILFDMSTHGVDQDFAQRLTGNRSLKHGQLAIFFSSFLSLGVGLLFLGIGALLWSFYQSHPFPAGVPNADHLFAHFIVTYFPVGLKGLMVAGVLAATMSTLDSVGNALCATLYNDILPGRKKRALTFYFFCDSAAITVSLVTVALLASQSSGLLLLGLKIQSWTTGPLLALFVTRVVFTRAFNYRFSATTVVATYLCAVAAVALNTLAWQGDWNWNTYLGCAAGLLLLAVVGRFGPKPNAGT